MFYGYIEGVSSIVSAGIQGKVPYLILHVTSACNARCRMCFNWEGMHERHQPRGISLEDLERLAASMNPLPQLTCSGGEPMLREDLPQILEAFYHKARTRFFLPCRPIAYCLTESLDLLNILFLIARMAF